MIELSTPNETSAINEPEIDYDVAAKLSNKEGASEKPHDQVNLGGRCRVGDVKIMDKNKSPPMSSSAPPPKTTTSLTSRPRTWMEKPTSIPPCHTRSHPSTLRRGLR